MTKIKCHDSIEQEQSGASVNLDGRVPSTYFFFSSGKYEDLDLKYHIVM